VDIFGLVEHGAVIGWMKEVGKGGGEGRV
jgi:hypothetical protein